MKRFGREKILIADDEPDLVEVIRFSLELEGIACLVAADGQEALFMARKERPDVIVLDIMMPKMNGFQVARALKADELFKHTPIIMLTARSQAADVRQGEAAGADRYITKPFDLDELLAVVKEYLQERGGNAHGHEKTDR
jgi:two-component system, OmpR family, alkaline phosphatase synthesis response regulator PhoP